MQHLGGAYAVEHRLARAVNPVFIHGRRQGLAGRHRGPQAGQVSPLLHGAQHRTVRSWCRETDGRPVLLNDFNQVWWRRVFQQRGRRAETQRKYGQATQAKGKRQRR